MVDKNICPIDGYPKCSESDSGRNCNDIYSKDPSDWKCPMVMELNMHDGVLDESKRFN